MNKEKMFKALLFLVVLVAVAVNLSAAKENYILGIDRISLNAAKSSNVWIASGSNQTGVGKLQNSLKFYPNILKLV